MYFGEFEGNCDTFVAFALQKEQKNTILSVYSCLSSKCLLRHTKDIYLSQSNFMKNTMTVLTLIFLKKKYVLFSVGVIMS